MLYFQLVDLKKDISNLLLLVPVSVQLGFSIFVRKTCFI